MQDVKYVYRKNVNNYGIAWIVRDTKTRSKKVDSTYDPDKVFETSMFFTAGPNAGNLGKWRGSMQRARSQHRCQAFFLDCVSRAVRSTLDVMIEEGVTVAVLAKKSCGAYAGKHAEWMNREFETVVNNMLTERITDDKTRGDYC